MKKPVSFRLDEGLEPFLKQKPNVGRYLNGLIKQDVHMKSAETIYIATTSKLLQDGEVLAKLAQALQRAGKQKIETKNDGMTYVQNDWGA
jgi:hypothetical protein